MRVIFIFPCMKSTAMVPNLWLGVPGRGHRMTERLTDD